MAFREPKIKKTEVSQTFNLKELLGYSPTEEQKNLFWELAVDKMVDRTLGGKDRDGRDFAQYSKEYAEKKGVPRTSVDMTLEGDMLQSFEDSQLRQRNMVKIKVGEGVETLKAFNHNDGDTLPKRAFFGFSNPDDLKDVISEVNSLRPQQQEDQQEAPSGFDVAELRDLMGAISIDFEGFD